MYWTLLALAIALPVLLILGVLRLANLYLRWKSRRLRSALLDSLATSPEDQLASKHKIIVGFFHPYW